MSLTRRTNESQERHELSEEDILYIQSRDIKETDLYFFLKKGFSVCRINEDGFGPDNLILTKKEEWDRAVSYMNDEIGKSFGSERKEINDNFDIKKLILDVIEGLLERSEPSDYGAKAYKLRRETEMTWNQIEKELDVNQALQLAKSFATRRLLPWPPR